MTAPSIFNFIVQKEDHKIRVERSFAAPLDLVWAAFTDAEILAMWWAPKPYQCVSHAQEFKEGGIWHYYMKGPEGDVHWCLFEYESITPQTGFKGQDAFCDENAVKNEIKPVAYWNYQFVDKGEETLVNIDISFDDLKSLESIIEMGFAEGFTMGLGNLDDYISAQFYLRKIKKPDQKKRVSTYLNFPGNTEEAFHFYKKVFRSEFVGGIQRFGDLPGGDKDNGMPDTVKNLILHVELPVLDTYLLMASDAPKEMGFEVKAGNNMHINLETDSREETERIFNELSQGGTVTQPLADMFWGAYFGSLTDKYGINWMVGYTA